MNTAWVLKELNQQRSQVWIKLKQLDEAIQVLSSISDRSNGVARTATNRRKRRMSPAARRRIIAAQKARWAKWRKQRKN